ncbi:hypothetical protein B4P00_21295 [Shewanella xiamenensis]|uniref:hypothetical protein n=1 Tax=Shewanella xiamenensis TaxID=332186 RepID=UPI001C4E0B71|nr:hypothetical protein [Shewanella xiamenensis]MBW0298709.1 hypothetical protein [Shewanella xiamenensis]
MYKIKSFGKDSIPISARDVIDTLNSRYQGSSVAIHIKKPSGIIHVIFVDVDPDGTVTDSYTQLPITVEFLQSCEDNSIDA